MIKIAFFVRQAVSENHLLLVPYSIAILHPDEKYRDLLQSYGIDKKNSKFKIVPE